MRPLSLAALNAINAQETGEVFCFLLTLSHSSFTAPIRICSGGIDITSRLNLYTFCPFEISLPPETDEAPPSVVLSVDNVDRSLIAAVRGVSDAIGIRLEVVLASSPDTVEAGPFDFLLRDVLYDALVISGTLRYEQILDEPYPADDFTPSRTPGVF